MRKFITRAYYAMCIFCIGAYVGIGCSNKNLRNQLAFSQECNAFKYELIEAYDDYYINSQKLIEKMDADSRICFSDTYGEGYEFDEMCQASQKVDSLLATCL